uniref:Uncharacterized protein n=1 Tax=Arundo donax TaxID=35708 RepID=A0A0A8ZY66_ARUDO
MHIFQFIFWCNLVRQSLCC